MAKKFHFRLQPLLRVRELKQRECERALAEVMTAIADLDDMDREADVEINNQRAATTTLATKSVDPTDLSRRREWLGHLQRLKMERALTRQELQAKAAVAREKYIAARQATKALEKLRENKFDAFRREQTRTEQSRMDEVAQQLQFVRPWGADDEEDATASMTR